MCFLLLLMHKINWISVIAIIISRYNDRAYKQAFLYWMLTHWGRVTHICVSKPTTIGSDNGLSPGRRQAIIWTNAGILLIGPLGTNLSEILREIHTFSLKKMHLKMSSGKWRPFCLGLNVLINCEFLYPHFFCNHTKNTTWALNHACPMHLLQHPRAGCLTPLDPTPLWHSWLLTD